mgnify:FL=1
MKRTFRIILYVIFALTILFVASSCNDAGCVQKNIEMKSDTFSTYRKVTVINLRSDKILLEVEGYLSIKDSTDKELAIIIQTGKNEYKMHYVYVGSEIVYLVEQLENTTTDPYHWYIRIHAVLPEII